MKPSPDAKIFHREETIGASYHDQFHGGRYVIPKLLDHPLVSLGKELGQPPRMDPPRVSLRLHFEISIFADFLQLLGIEPFLVSFAVKSDAIEFVTVVCGGPFEQVVHGYAFRGRVQTYGQMHDKLIELLQFSLSRGLDSVEDQFDVVRSLGWETAEIQIDGLSGDLVFLRPTVGRYFTVELLFAF